jgi:hypothetical protein
VDVFGISLGIKNIINVSEVVIFGIKLTVTSLDRHGLMRGGGYLGTRIEEGLSEV